MDDEDRQQLIRHLFAVVTGMLEDAATLAAAGQVKAHPEMGQRTALSLQTLVRQTETIADAIVSLTLDGPQI